MPIPVTCPQCSRSYEIPDSRAGQVGRCPCGATLVVPAAAPAPPVPFGASPPAGSGAPAVTPSSQVPPTAAPAAELAPPASPSRMQPVIFAAPEPVVPKAHAVEEGPNLLGGLALGLAAAVVACLLWYGVVTIAHLQLGLVAIFVGIIVALGVCRGAGASGDFRLQVLSVVITLVAMAYGEYLVARHFLAAAPSTGDRLSLPLLPSPVLGVAVVGASLASDPLTLLFWAIALWQAWKIPGKGGDEVGE